MKLYQRISLPFSFFRIIQKMRPRKKIDTDISGVFIASV